MKLRGAISKKETLDAATISKDNCCALGKWLHGESQATLGKLVSHKNCLQHHAEFHRQAGRVAQAINAGKYAEAEQMLGSESPYLKASQAVVMAIGTLKREAGL